ncbi:hypothetical protein [Streptomyces xanthochromogenes]
MNVMESAALTKVPGPRLRPQDAAAISDDELRRLIRAALKA